jgi:hypothetical protein
MSFESPENSKISEAEIIEALNAKGLEDVEVKALLDKYISQCQLEADAKYAANPTAETSNRANLEAAIKIATLYSKTDKYKDLGRAGLEEAREAVFQDPATQDLMEQINSLMSEF